MQGIPRPEGKVWAIYLLPPCFFLKMFWRQLADTIYTVASRARADGLGLQKLCNMQGALVGGLVYHMPYELVATHPPAASLSLGGCYLLTEARQKRCILEV
jgi:hypothetical protein